MTNNDEMALKLKAAAQAVIDDDCWVAQPEYWDLLEPQVILSLLAERDADKKRIADLEKKEIFLKERLAQLANFNPDWDMLEAATDSLREHAAELTSANQRIAELETVCAESYQVVGALADAAGVFETSEAVSKALDNLSDAKLTHDDVLPFVVEALTVSVKLLDCDFAAVQHMSGGSTDYCNGFVDGTQNAIKRFKADCAAAGINLEVGE